MLFFSRVAACIALAWAIGSANAANIVLNGDFENNSAGTTHFNLSDSAFNVFMSNAIAFGTAQEIDIVTSTDFGIAPESGNWKLGIHTQSSGANDAFSLTFSTPLVVGNTYSLQFFAAQYTGHVADISVGLSNSATSFGTQIFTGVPTSTSA